VAPRSRVVKDKLPWKKWAKVPVAVIGALATLFVVLQGLAWVDGRHDQTDEIVLIATEMKQMDEKLKSTTERLDVIDLIQAVGVKDQICNLAKKDPGLKQSCEKEKARVKQINKRLNK